jgi:ubiquinone/menaquinone biosynthesis C-methylase UbiE
MADSGAYGRVARFYDLLDLPFEYFRYRRIRPLLFADSRGDILDAGVGTGRNMPFYPKGARLAAIDRSARMLERARARQARLGIAVELRQAEVTATGFPDGRFDFVIASFLFCVLPEESQLPALRELARILKVQGEIRLLDYAYSRRPLRRLVMRLWAPWVRFAFGASFERDPARHAAAAGLALLEERFLYKDIIKLVRLRRRSGS